MVLADILQRPDIKPKTLQGFLEQLYSVVRVSPGFYKGSMT